MNFYDLPLSIHNNLDQQDASFYDVDENIEFYDEEVGLIDLEEIELDY